eukprot:TRINITY_DN3558_c0_g2_i1.p1 TRINITY_DN3558_c0_g2~~TRINITY_DN3558_c0_g2_i1.p1  ORF type:complete len:4446 (+),score=1220.06 TRINITY_DN3558_c0_g2_i1:273-13340(+)
MVQEAEGEEDERLKAFPQVIQVWRGLCSYLVQEVNMGRTVNVPNLGLFFSHEGPPRHIRFKILEKLMPQELHWDGPDPDTRPTTKAKFEKIAESLGMHKGKVDDSLQAVIREFWSTLKLSSEVELDFPGIGQLRVSRNTVAFLPTSEARPAPMRGTVQGITADHTMFGATAGALLKRMPQTPLKSPGSLPKLERNRSDISDTGIRASFATGLAQAGTKGLLKTGLGKSTSTPQLRPLDASGGATPDELQGPRRPPLEVPLPPSLTMRRSASGFLGAAPQEDPEVASRRLVRQLPVTDRLFPPLLDRCSRTRSALFREEVEIDMVSNVIASNYSVPASGMTIDHSIVTDINSTMIKWKKSRREAHKREKDEKANDGRAVDVRAVDWTAEWPTIVEGSVVSEEIDSVGMSPSEFCRILSRYRYYTEGGVPSEVLAPYNRQWLDHAVFLLDRQNVARWPAISEEQQTKVVEEVRHEILKGYIRAAKTAVVNYALLNSRCRERLDIPFIPVPPHEWGRLAFTVPDIGTPGGPPEHWRAGLAAARSKLLQVNVQNSRTALRLKEFWIDNCREVRLLSCPPKWSEVRDINGFANQQGQVLENSKWELTAAWQQVVQIVAEEPVYLIGGAGGPASGTGYQSLRDGSKNGESSPRATSFFGTSAEEMEAIFFDTVAAQLSQMAREAVEQTLGEYVELFERFANTPLHYEEVKALTSQDTWQDDILVNKLIVGPQGTDIRFKHDLDAVSARLLQPYKDCTTSLKEFPRPDTKLREVMSGRTYLWEVREDEDHIKAGFNRIEQIVRMNLQNAEKTLELYEPFLFLLDEEDRVTTFLEDASKTREHYIEYVQHLLDTIENLHTTCPNLIRMQLMRVDALEVNRKLEQNARDCIAKLLRSLALRNQDRSGRLVKQFEHLNMRIMRQPENEEQLVELEAAVEEAQNKTMPSLLAEYEDIKEWLFLTWDQEHLLVDEDYKAIWAASEWKSYANNINDRENDLKMDRMNIEGKLVERRTDVQEELNGTLTKVAKFKDKGNVRQLDEYLDELNTLKKQLATSQAKYEKINYEEELVGWDQTEFDVFAEATAALEPYDKLWNLVHDHQKASQKWTRSPLFSGEIKPEEVENDVNAMWRLAFKLKAQFEQEGLAKPAKAAEKVKSDLDQFKENVPLLHALCNPGLRKRHWAEISNVIGFQLEPDPSFTLSKVLDWDVGSYITEIGEISDSAAKEYLIESGLEAQVQEWEPIVMEFKDWGTTGTYIVAGSSVDEVQTLLDDHVIKTQTMKGSPFAGEFAGRLDEWEKYLVGVQDIVDVWLKVQGVWLYLEPIFSSEDIMQQMPTEGRLFREVDASWRDLMAKSVAEPNALVVFKQENFLEILRAANDKLETVQKGLNDYLETKRLYFPRFFFLSNDNLLEILSETKDPRRVNAHVKKAFEGMQSLQFEEDLKISAMISPEKENVPFTTLVDPVAANGAVEKWLVQVEDAMIESLRDLFFQSRDDYVQVPFVDWVQRWAGQLIIGVFNLFWTMEVNEALTEKGNQGLVEYAIKLDELLAEIVGLVRKEIPKLVRCTLEALIVIFVHNKDTIFDLRDRGTADVNDFDWLVQLRYFIEENPDKPGVEDVFVRITNSFLGYAYEYLGNCGRLVVTPLTDRCYRTCCGALHLMYGAAPEGPAGTGKTETVKDLAKALARFCVVFNCSDELDVNAMAKFFKGLASSGGWACFDEFNRIDAEVLSVIAQQILQIQNAIKARLNFFEFEGTANLPIKWTCNCFITMNPGYAGRAELPDNLKALFRTVAMMVPDYAMIAEIKLYSYGYSIARSLAQKIVTTYKLCSEQLSSQKHYDYGMRAVFSVLVAAGNLKRKYPQEREEILMLRSICDVNLAKFLAFDVPLFNGITSDLFPGVVLPKPDFGALTAKLEYHLTSEYCQPHPYFIEKIIQFYECHIVRHSVMLVGMPFSGKTTALSCLQKTLTDLANEGVMHEGCIVHQARLNPKSIPAPCLYGTFDEVSKEWADGIVAVLFREFGRNQTEERKWLVFDGPIDAVWIENMNTVMDENKKLCLNSGEIIAMSANMRTIMEPMDVNEASPATISRNGMVFFEPHLMGIDPLVEKNFLGAMPEGLEEDEEKEVRAMTEWLLKPCLQYLREECSEVSPTQDQNLVQSFFYLLMSHIKDYLQLDLYKRIAGNEAGAKKNIIQMIDAVVVFSMIWSVGAVCVTTSRPVFSTYFKTLLQGKVEGVQQYKKLQPEFPERGQIFDWVFSAEQLKWVGWMDTVDPQQIKAGSAVESLVIQTVDSVRYSYVLKHCISHRIKLLFCGPTGTGKTAYMQQALFALPKEGYMPITMGFSAQTKCAQTQDLIDAKLDRRRKGVYGPPLGKLCVLMVDDLNMPNKETYGAQPPIEILRQMIDSKAYPETGGWYERKDVTHPFRSIIDVLFFAAMGPPGGGRTFITPRMTGFQYLVAFPLLDDDNLKMIFTTILEWKLQADGFPDEITSLSKKLVNGTLEIYKASVDNLLPTPLKVHYTFNLRDFAKIMFGMLLLKKSECDGVARHVRLWVHEVWRVIGDRLVVKEDRMWMLEQARVITKNVFGQGFDEVMKHLDLDGDGKVQTIDEIRQLMFGDMLSQPAAPNRPYTECADLVELQKVVESHLDQYNLMSTKKMDLVCFLYMLEHLSRSARIIKTPGGNALLVGVGGSGRQSCARLACFLADFDVFQIEIARGYDQTAFREDIKKLLTAAGGKGEKTVFLFSDSQIKSEGFVEDLNNLLNTGEVPNLFPPEEKVQICEMVRGAARQEGKAPEGTPTQLYAYFVERCQKLLAVMLCFSPIGDAWRARIRQFPSIVNCCTIDWFTEWPADALVAVAERFLGVVEMEDSVRKSCVEMCSIFHEETTKLAVEFKDVLKRIYYATPTSFLELIQTFKTLLAAKRKQVTDLKDKYEKGLEKILTTEQSVEGMKVELINLQPKLVEKNVEVEKMMVVVGEESEKTAKVKEVVAADEAVASEAAAASEAVKADVEADLEEAMPALQEALGALDTLSAKDIGEIKAMKNPPAPVKLVLHAVCIMKGIKGNRVKDESGKMVEDFWGPSVKMVSESTFLSSLQSFDKDNIPPATIKKIQTFVPMDDFQPARVMTCSKAAWGICMWVRAMETYDRVAKVVGPKKEALAVAEAEYAKVMEKLNGKRAELQKVLDQLAQLEGQLNDLNTEKDDLAYQVDLCKKKLDRAETLIESLGGEKARWTENAAVLSVDYVNLTGDVIVSSGLIAYLGAFTPDFRERAVTQWTNISKDKEIPSSAKISLEGCLGEPVKIRNWTICGLPNDAFSIENGIVIDKSRRWPLCIDPQGQANKWIKKMEEPNKLAVKKFTDSDYIRRLEGCITYGTPMLIENILEETDPAIEPVLLKQTFAKGNRLMLKLGESTLEYNKDFKFYLTTKLRNPHYLPEIAVKVTLLNFMITVVGLQDQILNIVVQAERPELAEEKARLVLEGAENKAALEETENKILHVLQTSQGNILEDETAINVLSSSKALSNKIAAKQEIAEETEKQIDEARLGYVPVAFKTAILFFCIADLANIDPMYQYSLPFFINLFLASIEKAEMSDDLEVRIENLNDTFRYTLYCNICRSLFEKHKTLFSFLLCMRGLLAAEEADYDDYRFLLTGGVSLEDPPPRPADWVPDRCWGEMFRMNKGKELYHGFHEKFAEELDIWKNVYDDVNPMKLLKDEAKRPKAMEGFDALQDLMVLRCIRPDRVVPAVMDFVTLKIGEKFVTPPPFDLAGSYGDSNAMSPLIFILSPGADPGSALYRFAEEKNRQVNSISLGQGQGPKAEKLMDAAQKDGGWVLLQNCHLATSWMPKLERILDEKDPKKVHKDFRLWLTSYPSNKFPVAILQSGVKMTNEAPKGLRANITGSYNMDPISKEEFFEGCTNKKKFKRLCFNLCFFHAVIQERRLFGPLGWNIAYEFTENDLRISAMQLAMFLDEYPDETPVKALNYLTGECNYGGRVTEAMDRRLLATLLADYYSFEAAESESFILYSQDDMEPYRPPPDGTYETHLEHIRSLPLVSPPGVFGFHENANLTKEMGETYNMMRELLLTAGSGSSSGGSSPDIVVGDIAKDVLGRLPDAWNIPKIQEKYPTLYEESMNTVLAQELQRFNALIITIQNSLKDIQKAVKGLLLMSADLEKAFYEIFDGTTPAMWLKTSYPSLKPLGGYVNDLMDRLKFFQKWVDNGAPVMFWFSGIYFQQAFTTGATQNFARRYQIPIDTLTFDFFYPKEQEFTVKPEDGVYSYGLFFEACRWDWDKWELAESQPKVLYATVPLIHLMPCEKTKVRDFPHYECPCYKVSTRKGVLSTTGHSTNFVMPIKICSSTPSSHWIKRGVAMLTTLDT